MLDFEQAESRDPSKIGLTRRHLMSIALTTGAFGSAILAPGALAQENNAVNTDQIQKLLPGFRQMRLKTSGPRSTRS